jgi:hypothetical protein
VAALACRLEGAAGTIGVAIARTRTLEATRGFERRAGAGVSEEARGLTIRDDDQRALHVGQGGVSCIEASLEIQVGARIHFAGMRPIAAHELR